MRFLIFSLLILSTHLNAEVRTWTDAASGRELKADFISSDGKSVTVIRKTDNRRFVLAIDSLSPADRDFITRQSGENGEFPKVREDLFSDFKWKSAAEIPIDGKTAERFTAVDTVITAFMAEKGVAAVIAAISQDGEILYDRAFGHQEAKGTSPLRAGTRMRLASISKPLTSAVVKTLIRDGKIKESDTVWEILKLEETAPAKFDERWKEVTVAHLLEHEGGWDRDVSGDPSFKAPTIADDLRVDLDELTFDHFLQWMLERPLDFDPGSKEAYCNFGYSLLAHLCATVSETTWEELLNATVGKEAAMTTLTVSPSELENRVAGESWYHYHPEYERKPKVMPLRMEFKQGSGSITCSAADLCRFLETYWISGEPRENNGYSYTFFGSMPGTTSACRQMKNGMNFCVIANRRDDSPSDWNKELKDAIEAALE